MSKTIITAFLFLSLVAKNARADEGMWLPLLLKSLCESDMKSKGLKLSAEDLYSVNKSSLKDAIVLFGGGCTGEVVSNSGLLFTNHHCGIGMVQSHSSVENDYIKNGFWAASQKDELPNPGLTVTFIVRIEDMTKAVNDIVTANAGKTQKEIAQKIEELEKKAVEGTGYEADIKAFDYGNAYYMFVTETFKDVRLVGAPPQAVGEFGGDTDNWMWPRHTGDFSVFRIYADKNNKPAEYSPDNVPYKPKYSLTISTDGIKEGDFAMVYGFPGKTQQYLPAVAVDFLINESDPARITMRDHGLAVMNASMKASDKVRIQYTAKESKISNYWKKWKGEVMGLKKTNALETKRKFEATFMERVNAKPAWKEKYGGLFDAFNTLYANNKDAMLAFDYHTELYGASGPEIFKMAATCENLVNNYDALKQAGKLDETVGKLRKSVEAFYKNYDMSTDQRLFEEVVPVYMKDCPVVYQATSFQQELAAKNNSMSELAADLYKNSVVTHADQMMELLRDPAAMAAKIKTDKIYIMSMALLDIYRSTLEPAVKNYQGQMDQLMALYVEGIYEVIPEKKIWYDANSTMRVGYGTVSGSEPHDGLAYTAFTTTDGIMEKYQSGADEYKIPGKLEELITKKDFGDYADRDGKLHTCFTSTSQTTGGNSGSPVLNAKGELIGLNFDRSWESTMSDIMYSPKLCRNIVCDIRYVLFIMDKYAGATHLIKELNITNSQRKDRIKPVNK